MQYQLILLDVDGTLLPKGSLKPDVRVIRAAKALQAAGARVAIATGRSLPALPADVLGGLKPDYLICCNGAWLLDERRSTLETQPMTEQEMYALVDYCEDFDYPLAFVYPDAYYAYVEYARMHEFYANISGFKGIVVDGEDQDRHLEGMPLAAFGSMPGEAVEDFQKKYGHLELRFMPYKSDQFDIGTVRSDKAVGLARLMDRLGLTAEEVVAVGDGANDVHMLRLAGLGGCMANGNPDALAAADRIIPADSPAGLAEFLEGLL